jgi:hypothetical protein
VKSVVPSSELTYQHTHTPPIKITEPVPRSDPLMAHGNGGIPHFFSSEASTRLEATFENNLVLTNNAGLGHPLD